MAADFAVPLFSALAHDIVQSRLVRGKEMILERTSDLIPFWSLSFQESADRLVTSSAEAFGAGDHVRNIIVTYGADFQVSVR